MKTNDALRSGLIKLAHENPELRPHLLPLLSKKAGAPLVYTQAEAEAVFQVWVDALLSALGPTAKAGPIEAGPYEIHTDGPTYFGVKCQVEDPRLPGHWKNIDLEWIHHEPDTVKIYVSPGLSHDDKWISNMVKSMTGLRFLYVEAQGDLASLTRDAKPKINELMGTLNPIIMMESQRRRATGAFRKFSDLLKVKIGQAFQDSGFPAAKTWGGITGGEANVTNDGAPYFNLSLVVEGLLGTEELGDRARDKEVAAQARKVISRVTAKFTQDGVIAKLSSKPAYWSAGTYNTNIMIYFKDGPTPQVKFGSADAALRSRLVKLAYAQPSLRKPLLALLREAAAGPPNKITSWTAAPDKSSYSWSDGKTTFSIKRKISHGNTYYVLLVASSETFRDGELILKKTFQNKGVKFAPEEWLRNARILHRMVQAVVNGEGSVFFNDIAPVSSPEDFIQVG